MRGREGGKRSERKGGRNGGGEGRGMEGERGTRWEMGGVHVPQWRRWRGKD